MIEARKHYARGIDVELGVTEKGTEQVAIRFRIEGGSDDRQEIVYFGYFTDKTAQRTLESLRYCGWDTDDLGDLSAEVIGRNVVQLDIIHDAYEGKVRPKVAWVNRLGGPMLKTAMDDTQRRAFAARMKAMARGIDRGLAAPSEHTPPQSQRRDAAPDPFSVQQNHSRARMSDPGFEDAGFTDDDIPF